MDDSFRDGRSAPSRLTFSLAFLLAVVTLVCVILAIWASFRGYTVTAYLQVKSIAATSSRMLSLQEIEQQAMNAIALVTSQSAIEAALAKPGIGQIRNIQGNGNAANWLRNRLRVTFPGDGEIMELKLEGKNNGAEDDRQLLGAVVESYLAEVDKAGRAGSPMRAKVIQEPVIIQRLR
jgi:hypothetical protein